MDADSDKLTDIKIFGVTENVAVALKEYAKLKAGGKFNVALERLLSESSILYIFSTFAYKLNSLETRLEMIEAKDKKTIRTMTRNIQGRN